MPKLVCPHCEQKVRIPSVDLVALANPKGVAKVRCPACEGTLKVPVPRVTPSNTAEDSASSSADPAVSRTDKALHRKPQTRDSLDDRRSELQSSSRHTEESEGQRNPWDDNLWQAGSRNRSVRFPDPKNPAHVALLDPHAKVELPDRPMFRIEMDLIDERFTKQHGPELVERLRQRGMQFGPDGMVLRISANADWSRDDLVSSKDMIKVLNSQPVSKLRIPFVKYKWEIVDSDGKQIFEKETTDGFLYGQSRYYKPTSGRQQKRSPLPRDADGEFNFPDDPTKLIVEEILTHAKSLNSPPIPPEYAAPASSRQLPDGTEVSFPIPL